MTEKEIDKQRRKIAEDIAERAVKGEFGWVTGVNGGIPWNIYQEFHEVAKRFMPFIDDEEEEGELKED